MPEKKSDLLDFKILKQRAKEHLRTARDQDVFTIESARLKGDTYEVQTCYYDLRGHKRKVDLELNASTGALLSLADAKDDVKKK